MKTMCRFLGIILGYKKMFLHQNSNYFKEIISTPSNYTKAKLFKYLEFRRFLF